MLIELGFEAFRFYLDEGIFPELECKATQLLALTPDVGWSCHKRASVVAFVKELPKMREAIASASSVLALVLPTDMAQADRQSVEPMTCKARRLLGVLALINMNGARKKKGIIFVKQTALLYPLANLCRQDGYRVAEVGGVSSMTDKDRNNALEGFKRGDLELLIATNAAEEGIDVADCQFVIRFNRFDTTKSHIQGSGRARARDSVFYYFENDGAFEQTQAQMLTETAGDVALALSPDARAVHHDSGLMGGKQDLYPFQPTDEAQVNLSNANKILQYYCAVVMKQEIAPSDLCVFKVEPIRDNPKLDRRTLQSVRYPSPDGWKSISKDDAALNDIFQACLREIVSHPRYANLNNQQKDAKCFFFVAVVQMRTSGLLDARNKPSSGAAFYSRDACGTIAKESTLNIRPKFKGANRGSQLLGQTQVAERGTGGKEGEGGGGVVTGAGNGKVAAGMRGIDINSSFDDNVSLDSHVAVVGGWSSFDDGNIGDADMMHLSSLAANPWTATIPPLTPPLAHSSVLTAAEGGGRSVGEEGMLEVPSRADAKSWPSALREHLVSTYGQVAAEKMLECRVEKQQEKFRARIVIRYDEHTPILEVAWSGDCASKKKAQHVAACLAMMHLERCDGAGAFVAAIAISQVNTLQIGSPTSACRGESVLEAPLRADGKSWLSALREHLVSTCFQTPAEAEDMFRREMSERDNKFRARIVFKDTEQTPLREMVWSGYYAQKKQAQHVAAYLALQYLQRSVSSSAAPVPVHTPAQDLVSAAEGKGVGRSMLEAPPRTDAKSWQSALREHMVSMHGQAATEKMLQFEEEDRPYVKFRARYVLRNDGKTPTREMAWSGDCTSKKKAQHVAAYLALLHLDPSSL